MPRLVCAVLSNLFSVKRWMRWGLLSMAVILSSLMGPFAYATVYTDAENGSADWQVYDNNPVGAEVAIVFDETLQSNVIETRGNQRNNGYMLGGISAATGWNNTSELHANWRMQANESYAIYIRVETTDGWRYLTYSNSNSDALADSSGRYIRYGLGSNTTDGVWRVLSRDLAADLSSAQPDNTLLSVDGFLVRGSVRFDDIALADAPVRQTVLPVVSSIVDATAEDNSIAGWRIFDATPAGASITVVNDDTTGSLVYEFSGTGRSNAYSLGGLDETDGWNNQSEFILDWDMNVAESYQLYVRVDTSNGWRNLMYTGSNADSLLSSNGRDIGHGLGSASRDGEWHSYRRDLAADLLVAEPGNTLTAVHGLLVRGSMRLDNIRLSEASEVLAIPPVALITSELNTINLGDSITLDGSSSTDNTGIAAYQWSDGEGQVLGNESQLTVSPAVAGVWTYHLTVTDDGGLTSSTAFQITVDALDSSAVTVYEDAEDGLANRWRVSDTTPSGATVRNVVDSERNSRVIELTGTDQQNAYLLGNYQSRAPGWNNSHQTHLRWSMRTDTGFSVYVGVETTGGLRTLLYDQYTTDRGNSGSTTLRFGLGRGAHNGNWQTFTRDLYDDLARLQPDNSIIAVHGVQFRGNFRVDDIEMFSPGGRENNEPVYEDAEDLATSRWRVADNTPDGATIANVLDNDRESRVIDLSGNGQQNSYLIGNYNGSDPGWNNRRHSHLTWSMSTHEGFSVNVLVETIDGMRYLIYDQYTTERGSTSASNLRYGLGREAYSGNWQTFTRNLYADLGRLQPDNTLIAVHGVEFRGNIRVDDIRMLTIADTVPQAILEADPVSGPAPLLVDFSAAESSDDTGIVSYELDFGDGSDGVSGTGNEVSHVYPVNGDYTAVLTVRDAAGQSSTAQLDIQVLQDTVAPVAALSASETSGFAPLTVALSAASSTDNVGIVSYVWDFGDGEIAQGSTLANTSHTYSEEGEFTATVTVSDAAGNQAVATTLISTTIEEITDNPPIAAFSVVTPIEGSNVSFVNASTDDHEIVSVQWNFGDAVETDQSSVNDPSYNYSAIDDYTVTLTVIDNGGQMDTATQIISIAELSQVVEVLVADVSANALSGEAPFSVRLSGAGSTGGQGELSYQWLIEGLDEAGAVIESLRQVGVGETLDIVLEAVGLHRVTLTLGDDTEASATATLNLTVTAATPIEPIGGTSVTAEEAARLLAQATFGATSESIAEVQELGIEAWIDEQLMRQGDDHLHYVLASSNGSGQEARHDVWWRDAVEGDDQLRQRVAFALSQIFVVSDQGYTLRNSQYGITHYYDQLREHAFGSYRELLETVTLSPVMGVYLSMLQNARGDEAGNTRADENFAREVLQLFSIGLYELNIDGSQRLSGGEPIHSFTQKHIEDYARVFTGWNFGGATDWNLAPINGRANKLIPMEAWPQYHDEGTKHLLNGVTSQAGLSAEADLALALDSIASHANVAPFISKQLIKRLVTSNPTPSYVARVSRVFNDNGNGQRGDLGAVVKAILIDDEARNGHLTVQHYGKLREPVLRLSHLWRAFNITPGAASSNGVYNTASPHVKDLDSVGGQAVLKASSVFNFFRPDYAPLGRIYAQDMVAPEAEIYTDDMILNMTNRMDGQIQYGHDASNANARQRSYLQLAEERALAAVSTDALLDRLDLLLLSGGMSDDLRGILSNHLESLPSADSEEGQSIRVRDALSLIMASPDYLVQM